MTTMCNDSKHGAVYGLAHAGPLGETECVAGRCLFDPLPAVFLFKLIEIV